MRGRFSSTVQVTVALAALLVPCGSASAAILTATTVTSPAEGAHLHSVIGTVNMVTFAGTSSGFDDATTVDVRCLRRNAAGTGWTSMQIAAGVDTNDSSGEWSVDVDLGSKFGLNSCLVRAIEAGAAVPDDISAFTGPSVHFTSLWPTFVSGGINDGKRIGWWISAGLGGANVRMGSPVDFGVGGNHLINGSDMRESEMYWGYAATPSGIFGEAFDAPEGFKVDGNHAFLPDGAEFETFNGVHGDQMPGLGQFTVDVAYDQDGGGVRVVESAPLKRCNEDADQWVATASCTELVGTGVDLQRTFDVSSGGRQITIDEDYISTDGAAHTVQVQYYEESEAHAPGASFSFPWVSDGAFLPPLLAGAAIDLPPSAPWSWVSKSKSDAVDGDERYPTVARVTSAVPTTFKAIIGSSSGLLQTQTISVPAGGTRTLHHGLVADSTKAVVDVAVAGFYNRFVEPSATISAPAAGSTVDTVPMRVTGTASDNVGVASLTLNGVAVALSGGSFSAPFKPVVGSNTLTLVAADAAGGEKTVTSTFTYVPRNFIGTSRADILMGNSLANRLTGRGGADRISCGNGGRDVVMAGAGNDTIRCADRGSSAAQRRSRDTIDCGPGRKDRAVVDMFDTVRGCEVVTRT